MRRYLLGTTACLAISVLYASAAYAGDDQSVDELRREVQELKALVHQLQDQVVKTGSVLQEIVVQEQPAPASAPQELMPVPVAATAAEEPGTSNDKPKVAADLLHGMTINAMLDGYYEYNLNRPIGRVNYLRPYDVSSNSFSLNQADLMIENAPDVENGKRYGLRLDLQYGQATSTLQGNSANELRPDIYRNIFQAYGTYIFPVGNGLQVDFGKWASSLGYEGNYTKDQLDYSRSYWFQYLPFYHTGLRAKYAVTDELALNFWITNGTQQTEAFNDFKDQLYGFVYTPAPGLSWTFNYYRGQEHPDVAYLQNPTPEQQAVLPNQQGTYIQPLANPPNGLLNIFDTYASWQVTPEFLIGAEADYVTQTLYSGSPAQKVYGGAAYLSYQLAPDLTVSARSEYLADRGGLYSGTTQNLKETTFTLDYRLAEGFLVRSEFRRDWSNRPFFLTNALGSFSTDQPTIGIGLVWWMGQKEGAW